MTSDFEPTGQTPSSWNGHGNSPGKQGRLRPDIQGLRAFAVFAVIAFHAGLPVPGGFVGVDVFFVISGYVITGMLSRERLVTGGVNFGRFYARRIARLIPALGLVVGVTCVAAVFLLSPLGVQQLTAKTGAAGMLSLANGAIATSSGGYFLGPAERNPLLNLWSLSVEEQFYYIFPFVLAVGWFLGRRLHARWITLGLVLLLASLSYMVMAATVGAESFLTFVLTGFYSPVSRAWEFATGAALALVLVRRDGGPRYRVLGEVSGAVGTAMLVAALWIIGPSNSYPGNITLLPVMGTALVILAGSLGATWSQWVWSTRPFVWTGNRSYSLYLWHWPFIVFALAIWPLDPWVALIAAVTSVVPSLISFRFVESRFRHFRLSNKSQWLKFSALAVLLPLATAVATYGVAQNVWRPLYERGEFSAFSESIGNQAQSDSVVGISFPCADESLLTLGYVEDGINHCIQSKASGAVDVAVIGDSHAEHLYSGLARSLPDENVATYFFPAGVEPAAPPFDQIFSRVAESKTIRTVVVSAYWVARGVPGESLAKELTELSRGGKQVVITSDVPGFPFDSEVCKFRLAPVLSASLCEAPRDVVLANHDLVMEDLRSLVGKVPGAVLVDTWDFLCPGETCSMAPDGQLLYRDPHHLNAEGSDALAGVILRERSSTP